MRQRFQTRPLYLQVRDAMVERIRRRDWGPNSQVPNEQSLAQEFGVSQGTIRKAMSVLEEERMVRRLQGRGTFVTVLDSQEISFKYYPIKGLEGIPTRGETSLEVAFATEREQAKLDLRPAHKVIRIKRLRLRDEAPFMFEEISLPERRFPQLAKENDIPSFLLLACFEAAGVIAKSATEQVTAVAADEELSEKLQVDVGTPLLKVDRVVYDSDDHPFETRIRICNLGEGYYEAQIR